MRFQITHVRPDGLDFDRRIDAVWAGGMAWTIDQVIQAIETRRASFYVSVGYHQVEVVVRIHPVSRRKYIATTSDGFPPNNLLNLPRF